MTLHPSAAPVVQAFVEQVRPAAGVVGFYAGGSLATGDYHPGISDLDLVALVQTPLTAEQESRLKELHRALMERWPEAAKLHCFYLPVSEATDVAQPHVNWAHRELYRRPLSGVARAELLRHGVAVHGPPVSTLLPPVTDAELAAAARAELTGYWTGALGKRHLWVQDLYVDLGLTTLARVEATLAGGRLITKTDAITRLDRFGVPPSLIDEIARRRRGLPTTTTVTARTCRAALARRLMAAGIDRLTSAG